MQHGHHGHLGLVAVNPVIMDTLNGVEPVQKHYTAAIQRVNTAPPRIRKFVMLFHVLVSIFL